MVLLLSIPAVAADIDLTLHQQSIDDNITITVENSSAVSVVIDSVYTELDGRRYDYAVSGGIPPYDKKVFHFRVELPSLDGTYPVIVTVRYLNDGKILSLRHAGLFHFRDPAQLNASCIAENATLDGNGSIVIRSDNQAPWTLVLPEEIEILSQEAFPDRKEFRIKNRVSGFRNTYPFFAVAEEETGNRHFTSMCAGTLSVNAGSPMQSSRGHLPSGLLLLLSATFFLTMAAFIINRSTTTFTSAFQKYLTRMFFITAAYFILKNAAAWPNYSMEHIDWLPYRYITGFFLTSLNSGNYQYFFDYFIDVYLMACLFLTFPYLYYFDRDRSVGEDKYVSFFRTILSVFNVFRGQRIYWNKLSRLGMLTIFVKFFFAPLLVSWSINNMLHIGNAPSMLQWEFQTINAFMVDLLILTDTAIFAFGYIIESRSLRSEIKSVEPTFFGWLVCLWCYPPFNAFSFRPFDYPIINISISSPQWVHIVMTCVLTFLWGIFTWASVALGFKASNLTNRGIVKTGPYRYVRHPAYTVKILIWLIQGIFFSQFGLGILLAFTVIYILRAWTEERHLSMDTDYEEYRKMVKWRFVPGLI